MPPRSRVATAWPTAAVGTGAEPLQPTGMAHIRVCCGTHTSPRISSPSCTVQGTGAKRRLCSTSQGNTLQSPTKSTAPAALGGGASSTFHRYVQLQQHIQGEQHPDCMCAPGTGTKLQVAAVTGTKLSSHNLLKRRCKSTSDTCCNQRGMGLQNHPWLHPATALHMHHTAPVLVHG